MWSLLCYMFWIQVNKMELEEMKKKQMIVKFWKRLMSDIEEKPFKVADGKNLLLFSIRNGFYVFKLFKKIGPEYTKAPFKFLNFFEENQIKR